MSVQDMLVASVVLFKGLKTNRIFSKSLPDFSAIGVINAGYITADNQKMYSKTFFNLQDLTSRK